MAGVDDVRHMIFGIHNRYPLGRNAWCYDQLITPQPPMLAHERSKSADFSAFTFSNWLLEPELADMAKAADPLKADNPAA
jgi:hypothetical protein